MFLRSLGMCLVGIASAAAYNPYAQAMELAVVPVVTSFLSFTQQTFIYVGMHVCMYYIICNMCGHLCVCVCACECMKYRKELRRTYLRADTNTHAAQSSTQPDNDARMFKRHELGVREDHG